MNRSTILLFVAISLFVSFVKGAEKLPFFALCMDTHDEKNRSIDEQNEMLHDIGFNGVANLWLDGLPERVASAKKTGLKIVQIYFQIDLAAEQSFDGRLTEILPCVKDQGTQLALLIYGGKPSDTTLDDKAVGVIQEIGRA
jgi:hypothetical protein